MTDGLPRRRSRAIRRLPLIAIGFLSGAWGVWLGLIRVGWRLPLPWPDQLIAHGPLMIGGFLGTVIALERAVALGSGWAYLAPLTTAAGAVLLVLGPPGPTGPLLFTLGSLLVVLILVIVSWRQPALFLLTMAAGAIAWLAGNLQWISGGAISRVVLWWIAFLVLTIAGERLELNRVLRPTRAVRATFTIAMALILMGAASRVVWPAWGVRCFGGGLLLLTTWLVRHDVARHTVRQRGLTRFMAVCLLAGYVWLGVGAIVAMVSGAASNGVVYDAMLHAWLLGFVMSMIFAHAPIILPAVLAVRLDYRPSFYAHLLLLHVSVAVRLAGDLVEDLGRWRAWGALLNAMALLMFVANTARSIHAGVAAGRAANT